MKNNENAPLLENLHKDFLPLLKSKKLHPKSAFYISCLDVDAEQLWILRFYNEYGILPKIKQAREIKEAYDRKKLTLKVFRAIMKKSLEPKKLVFQYSDLSPFFADNTPQEEMKREVIKVLGYWKNNISI